MSADISKSSFFRLMESTCCTLIIDDFDSIGDDQKKDVLQHYKTGYKNTSKSVRTGEGKVRKIEAFRNYGHVIMNNTSGLDDISADRSKFIPMLKYDGDKTALMISESSPEWQEITDTLYWAALEHWEEVQKDYKLLKSSELRGRKFEITRPILTLANFIGGKPLLEEIETFFINQFANKEGGDMESDWGYQALQTFKHAEKGHTIPLKDITETIAPIVFDDNSSDFTRRKRGLSKWLGKFFANLPVFKKIKLTGVNNIRLISKSNLEKYMLTKGWTWVDVGGQSGCESTGKKIEVEEI